MSRYDRLPDSITDINPYHGEDPYAMISSSSSSSSSPASVDFIEKAARSAKGHNNLTIPDLSTFQPSALRSLTTSPFSEHELLSPSFQHIRRTLSRSPSPSRFFQSSHTSSLKSQVINFLHRNRPLFQVAFAQLFGALMNLSARLLELSGEGEGGKEGKAGMHPFQILFARMLLTSVLSLLYMHWKKVEFAPWGRREVRWLLVLRGVTGFFGIFPLWYSMLYLPIAEATVITFLAPSLSGYLSHLLLKDPFTKKEQIASFVALAGVVLIARPISFLLPSSSSSSPAATTTVSSPSFSSSPNNVTSPASPANHIPDEVPPSLRLLGIASALLSVLGASAAYTTIRALGPSTHPLISVNYFSLWCTFVSLLALLLCPVLDIGQEATDLVPAIRWGLPRGFYQWGLLVGLGVAGFVMQFLLTSGLGAGPGDHKDGDGKGRGRGEDGSELESGGERTRGKRMPMTKGATKSNRATAMIYTQMLFAAGFDKWVFGRTMSGWSVVGCGLIVGSALWAVLGKETTSVKKEGVERDGHIHEEGADLEMVGGMRENTSRRGSGEEEEGEPMLRGTEVVEEEGASRGQRTGD